MTKLEKEKLKAYLSANFICDISDDYDASYGGIDGMTLESLLELIDKYEG